MKNVLWFVFFIAVCGYADRPRFDNESDNEQMFDNEGYFDYETYKDSKKYKDSIYKESIELYKETTEYKEAIERIFGKTRFGVRIGIGGWKAGMTGPQQELGGLATIPLSKSGPFLFDVELNYIGRGNGFDTHESVLSILLLIQYADFYKIGIVAEAGIILDFPLYSEAPPERDNPFQYRKSIDPGLALGTGVRMKNFTVGIRIIYYPIFDEFDGSGCAVFNLGVGYLF